MAGRLQPRDVSATPRVCCSCSRSATTQQRHIVSPCRARDASAPSAARFAARRRRRARRDVRAGGAAGGAGGSRPPARRGPRAGALTPLDIPVSGFRLHPIVGVADSRPRLTAPTARWRASSRSTVDELLDPAHSLPTASGSATALRVSPGVSRREATRFGVRPPWSCEFLRARLETIVQAAFWLIHFRAHRARFCLYDEPI